MFSSSLFSPLLFLVVPSRAGAQLNKCNSIRPSVPIRYSACAVGRVSEANEGATRRVVPACLHKNDDPHQFAVGNYPFAYNIVKLEVMGPMGPFVTQ